jgi:hypothetical protein
MRVNLALDIQEPRIISPPKYFLPIWLVGVSLSIVPSAAADV